jgi:hypothetical protein
MDNKKFEQLIDLIINENEEQAKALFHDIVVEKSREIYESMMDEDGMGGTNMGGQVGDLLDEIGAEEQGMTEEEDDLEFGDDGDDEVVDLEMGDEEGGEEGLEDRVVDLEDKLDQLMAEFEEIMGGDDESDAEFDDSAEEDGADLTHDLEAGHDEEDQAMMEAIALKNVPGLYGSKIGGDNGVQTKSTNLNNSGQAGMDSRPVKFSGDNEPVPTSPKAPSNYGTKGETQVKGAGSFKNAPAQAKQSLEKAPAPTKTQASGVNTKSPVAESRNSTKRRV